MQNIFQAFDPDRNSLEFVMSIPEFRPEELLRAVKRLAPGPSGIPNEILRALALAQPRAVLRAFKNCLEALTFSPRGR